MYINFSSAFNFLKYFFHLLPSMEIKIANNYAGSICNVKFDKSDEWFGIAVTIHGYIETNSILLEHCKSHGKFVESEFNFKVPKNIIPSYHSKNFKVYYELDCLLLNKDRKRFFKVPLILHNENVSDFSFDESYPFELEIENPAIFEQNRAKVCNLLLKELECNPKELSYLLKDRNSDSSNFDKETFQIEQHRLIRSDIPIEKEKQNDDLTDQLENENIDSSKIPEASVNILKVDIAAEETKSKQLDKEKVSRFTNFDLNQISKNYVHNGFYTFSNEFINKLDEISKIHNTSTEDKDSEIGNLLSGFECEDHNDSNINRDLVESNNENQKETRIHSLSGISPQLFDSLRDIQLNTAKPVFPETNIFNVTCNDISYSVLNENEEIAKIKFHEFFTCPGKIKIEFKKNVKNTTLQVWRNDYEGSKLIDAELLFNFSFDSEFCLEKTIKCNFEGCSMKNPIFEVKILLFVNLDNSEVSIPLKVLSPYTLINNIL